MSAHWPVNRPSTVLNFELQYICREIWRERRDSNPAASCVTGRRSNQLNYAPALNQRFSEITVCAFPCLSIPKSS